MTLTKLFIGQITVSLWAAQWAAAMLDWSPFKTNCEPDGYRHTGRASLQ